MNKLRRSYEARVLLVPLGAQASALSAVMAGSGLDGVMTLTCTTHGDAARYAVRPLAAHGWAPAGETASLTAVAEADITVLLVGDLAEVEVSTCRRVAEMAQRNGTLIAALVVGQANTETPARNSAMATLREAVDMLVVVRSLRLATPFIDVLRGGSREPALAG